MVLEKVIDIIAEELSVDPSEITEDSNLVEDLDGWRNRSVHRRTSGSVIFALCMKFFALCKTI